MRLSPSPPDRRLPVSVVALLIGCLAQPVQAQIFTGIGDPVAAPAAPIAVTKPSAPAETLRFLPNTLEGLRLSGETGNRRWPVFLTAAQAAMPVRLRIGYVSAVSVLPDASMLELTVNDQPVGSDHIDAATGLRTVEFALPAGLLRPGYNAVALSIQQRHRVDCSVAATYELWTALDPNETGLVLSGATRSVTDLVDLPALLPRADGSMPIHVLLNGKINAARLQYLIKATQQITLNGGFSQPAVDFETGAPDPYGIDLVVGLRATLSTLPAFAGSLGLSGPLARFLPGETGRPTLIVTGSTDSEVEAAIDQLAGAATPIGTPAGLRAVDAYPAFKVAGGEHLRLSDLGLRDDTFSGRFFRRGFNLMLPADFLASDYGRGTFELAGAYAPGLAGDAQVRFDVNGHSSGVVKMPHAKGDTFNHNQLFLPLSLMRPGLNHIDISAETQRAEDATCTATDEKRFAMLDTSELTIPTLAHVERLPDLAGLTSGALPYLRGDARLVVPKPDRETMAAALSLTARAAVAAGRLVPFTFSTKVASKATGSTLIISPAQALDPAVLREIGLDPAKIEAAWKAQADPKAQADLKADTSPAKPEDITDPQARWWLASGNGPAACHVSARSQLPVEGTNTDGEDLLDQKTSADRPRDGWTSRVVGTMGDLSTWIDGLHPFGAPALDGIAPDASMIMAQGVDAGPGNFVTTIVTAPDARTLRGSVACLFDPQVWSKVHGRLAALDGASGRVAAVDATSLRYVQSGITSLTNSRLVLAGWFSLNPLAFVSLALLTALCLGGTTLWFVRGIGRRPE